MKKLEKISVIAFLALGFVVNTESAAQELSPNYRPVSQLQQQPTIIYVPVPVAYNPALQPNYIVPAQPMENLYEKNRNMNGSGFNSASGGIDLETRKNYGKGQFPEGSADYKHEGFWN